MQSGSLKTVIENLLDGFFLDHKDHSPESGLYHKIMNEVENSLIIKTLEFVAYNQQKASKILGISRNTLRKKLQRN
jgi:Fis family transcriptional regulator